ncbi:hypothetical protein E4U17_001918 [Claviceps sp. LM77 group G4]|nr:hypothetical protein E4U17_001918 [Claviceps sp. LM77 group G4]
MWAKIGEELKVGWKVAEDMHWNIGAKEMEERADIPLSFQATVEFAPSQARNVEAHQHRDQEHDLFGDFAKFCGNHGRYRDALETTSTPDIEKAGILPDTVRSSQR